MPGYTEYVLAEGSFSYGQAVAVINRLPQCVYPG
ncbi:putative plasmid-like protein [Escherichia coli]|nr:putative plasmid-like protein [Escherichia coli]